MAYFAVFATDRPDTTRLRADTREAHRRHLREPGRHRVSIQFGGPTLTNDGTRMNGTLLVIAADNMDAGQAFLSSEASRVWKECVSMCRSWWSPNIDKKKQKQKKS